MNLRGGTLALDFANSVDWDQEWVECKDEVFVDADALGRWGVRLGVYDAVPDSNDLRAVKKLRAAMHRVFSAIASGDDPAREDLAAIEREYGAAVRAGRLAADEDEHDAWRMTWPRDDVRRLRYAVVADAIALLGDGDRLARVARCPGRDCGWLFLDTSGKRRWCSMDTCGSRAKMRAMYDRRRSEATGRSRRDR